LPETDEHARDSTHAPPGNDPALGTETRRLRRSLVPALVTLLMTAGAATGGTALVRERVAGRAHMDLGRAVLAAESVDIGPTDAAVVTDIGVTAQTKVHAGQELARLRLSGVPTAGGPAVEILKAPSDATVVRVLGSLGTTLRAGEPLLTLYDPQKLTFEVVVPVEKLRKLRVGMAVSVSGPGTAEPVPTTVDSVVPRVGGDATSGPDALTVVLHPDNPAQVSSLVPGLPFNATVDTNTAQQGTPALGSA
jgi:multidrug resistance efflux pump